MAAFRRYFEKLARPPEDVRADNLAHWATSIDGVTLIRDVEPRKRHKVAGVIQNVRVDPREGSGSIEATIIDGTGELVAKWLGRSSLQGIRLGVGLILEGICGSTAGDKVILNPEYDLVPDPEHG